MSEPSDALARWREIYALFTIKGDPARAYPKPTEDDLDRFEAETGIKLPASYRAYCQVFGAGVFDLDAVNLRVSAPNCPDDVLDLKQALDILEGHKSMSDWTPRARRAIFFANSFRGDRFGWDPEDVSDPDAPEFRVFGHIRHDDDLTKLADDFYDFITLCMDSPAFSEPMRLMTYEEETGEPAPAPQRVFIPVGADFI